MGRKQHDGKIPNQWMWNLTRWLYKLFLCLSLTLGQMFACLRKQWTLKNSRSGSLAQIFFQIEWTIVRTQGAFFSRTLCTALMMLTGVWWLPAWNLERKGKLFSSYDRQTCLVIRGQEQVMQWFKCTDIEENWTESPWNTRKSVSCRKSNTYW